MEPKDANQNEKKSSKQRSLLFIQILYIFLGLIFLALGIVGIPIPILPTTPFMLLAGYFFLRSSEKLNNWLRNHKYFRRFFIQDGLTLRGKILLDGFVWIMLIVTAVLAQELWVWILTMSLGVMKTLYFIFVLKTKPNPRNQSPTQKTENRSNLIVEKE